jgi:hypothetical protein
MLSCVQSLLANVVISDNVLKLDIPARSYNFPKEIATMFCPRCAVQNLDDSKFCRGCGTNLETVMLALADKYHPAKSDQPNLSFERWPEARKKAIDQIVKGIGLNLSSLLFGVAIAIFSHDPDWILIWMCLAGWLTVIGIISMLKGTTGLMESRSMRRQLGEASGKATGAIPPLPVADRLQVGDVITAPMLRPQSSVTEHTTTRLVKPEPSSGSGFDPG